MQLAEYLKREGLTLAAFAERIGRTEATVSRIARGKTHPDPGTVRAIREATGGEVEPNDFFSEAEPATDGSARDDAA